MAKKNLSRYAAKLLFQHRIVKKKKSNTTRNCEVRITVLQAPSAKAALEMVKIHAQKAAFITPWEGGILHNEFVGVLDLLKLGEECGPEEVWYEYIKINRPLEQARKLIPKESTLNAMMWELKGSRR